MEFLTISQVSKQFHISTRMLRYYEKEGLLCSSRRQDYSYRIYDGEAVRRLQQILVFRKLRIPVKQIAEILNDREQVRTLEITQENLRQINEEIAALSLMRDVLNRMAEKLDGNLKRRVRLDLLEDGEIMDIIHVLEPPKTNLKEGYSMEDLTKADKAMERKMEIRIVYLPPAEVASYQYVGENPEDPAGDMILDFIKKSDLARIKPDFRLYGFNNPSPAEGQKEYGYEFWATIPEDMEVQAPLKKKHFNGGLYAAHCIKMGDFHEWEGFVRQVLASKEYEGDFREPRGMDGCLEEELNIYTNVAEGKRENVQLDLLIPIKKRGS